MRVLKNKLVQLAQILGIQGYLFGVKCEKHLKLESVKKGA
jgi:hypothetical protein